MSTTTTYVITGASRGIGLEFVKQLSSTSKENVIFALARNPNDSKDLLELVKNNNNIKTVTLDVSDEASIKEAAEKVAQLAPHGIDVLINNAGISGRPTDTLGM
jgi:NAD(P)-dependent dehydrogenase (short-subunit alcohol dehydrogenase family)